MQTEGFEQNETLSRTSDKVRMDEMSNEELINIILRKDDVERDLRNQNKQLDEENCKLREILENEMPKNRTSEDFVDFSKESQVSNEETSSSFGAVAITVVSGLLAVLFAINDDNVLPIITFAVAVVAPLANLIYRFATTPTNKNIIRTLKRNGYECGLHEGHLFFKRNDLEWRIPTWDESKRYRRTYFALSLGNQQGMKDNEDIANKIVRMVGFDNPHVLVAYSGDEYECVIFAFHTVLTTTRDIMREFNQAMSLIDTAMNEFFSLKEQLIDSAPSGQQSKIGFKSGEKA